MINSKNGILYICNQAMAQTIADLSDQNPILYHPMEIIPKPVAIHLEITLKIICCGQSLTSGIDESMEIA